MCESCGLPGRALWCFADLPPLDDVHVGNWMELKRCPQCGALWVSVPHEPYAAFEFVTDWPFSVDQWRAVHAIDDAKTLHEWHNAVIREQWRSLPDGEIERVERWRDRTDRCHNPIDRDRDANPPSVIHNADDIRAVIDSLT